MAMMNGEIGSFPATRPFLIPACLHAMSGLAVIDCRHWPLRMATGLCLLAASWASAADRLPPAYEGPVDFRRDIYPILSARCLECHRGDDAFSGVRLDDRDQLFSTIGGRAVVAPR